MKVKNICCVSLVLLFAHSAIAKHLNSPTPLQLERAKVMQQYILDLGTADYKDISTLFDKNGIVISTSRGKMNAKEFFYAVLPALHSTNTAFHQAFMGVTDTDRNAARFRFSYKTNDGEASTGEYVDEFVFSSRTAKLTAVYMFENMKFGSEN